MRKLLGILSITSSLSLLVLVQMALHQPLPVVRAVTNMPPVLAITPSSLSSVQPVDSLISQTLTIQNLGDDNLDWHVYDGTASLWEQTDNTSFVNGAPSQYFPDLAQGGYAGDDFVVPAGETWQIDQIFVPGSYTAGAGPAPNFDVTLYDDLGGAPNVIVANKTAVSPLSDVDGDITLDLNSSIVLTAGTYWLSVNANMNFAGPPEQWFWTARTVQTGAPYHWLETGVFGTSCMSVWQPGAAVCDVGGGVDPDLGFSLRSDYPDAECDPISTIPWVEVTPISGVIAVSSTLPVEVNFDSSGYVLGVYTGTLCIASNDPVQPLLSIPLTMTVVEPAFGVEIGPDSIGVNLPNAYVNYTLSVVNIGNAADVYTLTANSTWTTTLSVNNIALAAGASGSVMVTVSVPSEALLGEMDTAVITATSQSDLKITESAILTTTAAMPPTVYLPIVVGSE